MVAPKSILPSDIRTQHPTFSQNSVLWEELTQLADGRLDNPRLWLTKRVGEEPEIYANRLDKLTYNPVYVQCLLALKKGTHKGFIKVEGSEVTPESLIKLAGELVTIIANYGSAWLSYDADGQPYCLPPTFICDYEKIGGQLKWVKAHTLKRVAIDPFKPAEITEQYHIWTETQALTYRLDSEKLFFKQVSSEPIDRIPFVHIEVTPSQWLGRICYTKLRQLIGLESSISDASSNLYIQRTVENAKPLPDDDLGDTYANAAPGAVYTSNAYVVSGKFAFAEAVGTSVSINLELAKAIESQIRSLIGLEAAHNSGRVESGESKRYDFKDYADVLSSYGGDIVKALSAVLSLAEGREVNVTGLDEFELDNLRSMLEIEPQVTLAADKLTPAIVEAWYKKLGSALSPSI